MSGEQSNEEKLLLEARIKDLTNELDERTTTHNLLSLQLKRLQVKCYFFHLSKVISSIEIILCLKLTYSKYFLEKI